MGMIKLPHMAQNMFNTPIMLSSRKAEMIVAALSGKFDITALTNETRQFDAEALRDLSARGRQDAYLDRERDMAKRKKATTGPWASQEPYWGDKPYWLSPSGIAVIDVAGTLTRSYGLNPESGFTGYDGIWTKLAFAMDDEDCKGIWFKINSGGGAVDGLMDLAEAIWKCSARNGGKPIWAFAGDYAYSAAYMIGASGDKFYAPPLGGVGSVSALAVFIDYTAAMEEAGLKAVIFRGQARKAIGVGGMETLDDAETAHIQEQVNEASDFFIDRVSTYRGIAKSRVSQTQGNDYTATQAKAIGFIDGILTEQDAWLKFERHLAAL
jgi:ClpP class serine protease